MERTTPRIILRDSALVLPGLLVVGFLVDGWRGALGTGLAGGVSLVNLAAMAWLTRSGDPGKALVWLVPKLVLALCAFGLLALAVDPFQIGLALGGVMLAFAASGAIRGWRDLEDPCEWTEAAPDREG